MPKIDVSLSAKALQKVNELLSHGFEVRISLVGKRLRIAKVKSTVEYDVMISD